MLNLAKESCEQHVLTANEVDDALAELFSTSSNVNTVSFEGNIVPTSVLARTLNMLVTGPTAPGTVCNLNLSCCGVAEESVCCLMEALHHRAALMTKSASPTERPLLEILDLSYNALCDSDIVSIAEALFRINNLYSSCTSHPAIRVLSLRGNCFTNEGLSTLLQSKTGLVEIDVGYSTGLTGEGLCGILCDSLLVHPTLQQLYFGGVLTAGVLTDEEWRKVTATGKDNVHEAVSVHSHSRSRVEVSDMPASPSRTTQPRMKAASPAKEVLPAEAVAHSPEVVQASTKVGLHPLGASSPRTAVRRLEETNRELVEEIMAAREKIAQLEQKKKKKRIVKKKTSDGVASKENNAKGKAPLKVNDSKSTKGLKPSLGLNSLHKDPFRPTAMSRKGIYDVPPPDSSMKAVASHRREMF